MQSVISYDTWSACTCYANFANRSLNTDQTNNILWPVDMMPCHKLRSVHNDTNSINKGRISGRPDLRIKKVVFDSFLSAMALFNAIELKIGLRGSS